MERRSPIQTWSGVDPSNGRTATVLLGKTSVIHERRRSDSAACRTTSNRYIGRRGYRKIWDDGDREQNMGHISEDYCRSCTDTAQLVQGKWKMHILCAIRSGPVRLGRLTRALPTASKKVLTENRRKLEQDGLVARRDLGGTVPHVEYDFRSDMRPTIESMLDHLASFNAQVNVLSSKAPACELRPRVRRPK